MSQDLSTDPQALVSRITEAANSLSDAEASQRYQQILAQLPHDQASELNALALSQVAPSERNSMASQLKQAHNDPSSPFDGYTFGNDAEAANPVNLGHMTARAQQQDPSLLGGLLGNNSALGGTIGKAALAALAALLVRRLMSGQGGGYAQSTSGSSPMGSILGGLLGGGSNVGGGSMGGDPVGSILGGLLGGGSSTGGLGGYSGQQVPASNDPMGSILGGLLGGGSAGGMSNQSMPSGGLGSILGGLLGGGAGTQYLPSSSGGGGGLGSILGSILGGGAASSASSAPGSGSHRKG